MPGSGNGCPDTGEHDSSPPGSFTELKRLLVGPERDRLDALERRLNNPDERATDVSAVLSQAVTLSRNRDGRLRSSLEPLIAQALRSSVQKDPSIVGDTLYPVIGVAIRKAVAAALGRMVESLNQTLEYSLSFRSLRWRFEALRTGKPYGEIVLARSVRYSVQLVFLIHRKTGLLLESAMSETNLVRDPHLVSGMLTAVQDFVRDSFTGAEGQDLEVVQVGDFTVWIQHGPLALMAAVVRGVPPAGLRTRLQEQLEALHRDAVRELGAFQGDSSSLSAAKPYLEACLVGALGDRPPKRHTAIWVSAVLLIAAALAVWLFLGYRERARFNAYVERVRSEPGIVVTGALRQNGRYIIAGLRDPMSRDPRALASEAGLASTQVEFRLEPYQSLRPEFANARKLETVIADLRTSTIGFAKGKSNFEPGTVTVLRRIEFDLQTLLATAREDGRSVHVDVIGSTDPEGSAATNTQLAQDRAEAVVSALVQMGFDRGLFSALRDEPAAPGSPPAAGEPASQRRATLRVTLSGGARR
jgi:outer membrane protein OmpA-like peptidoglycan-associated protein